MKKGILISLILFIVNPIFSYDPAYSKSKNEKPSELKGLELTVPLGEKINTNLSFINEKGEEIKLSSIFDKGKPVVLSPVYYKCPTLCNFHLNGVTKVMQKLEWNAGDKFNYVAFSFDPNEGPEVTLPKKEAYEKEYNRTKNRSKGGWYFLTGKEESIKELTYSLGFPYRWNPGNSQWIHPSVVYILTPEGKISRYFNGIEFSDIELKLALVEASDGKVGTFLDQAALFCFQFDPNKGRYTIYAFNMMRIGAGLTVLFLGTFLLNYWRKNRKSVVF
ncbi:MAG: SCO family protein [Leptospiraceae bacterium]|nr:SCO family protein [Leptospiraceae bacterium]